MYRDNIEYDSTFIPKLRVLAHLLIGFLINVDGIFEIK